MSDVLQVAGKIAGVAGLALGVFLLLFREIIRKSIFPQFSQARAERLLILIVILVWTVAIAGLAPWVYVSIIRDSSPPTPAAIGTDQLWGDAMSSLAALETESAYDRFSVLAKNAPTRLESSKALALTVLMEASEIAAHHQLAGIYSDGAAASSGWTQHRIDSARLRSVEQIRSWGRRLCTDSAGITSFAGTELTVAVTATPDALDVLHLAQNFNATRDRVRDGSLPTDTDLRDFERMGRYLFLSLTLGRALGVETAPVKTGFLAAWRDGSLKGRLEWTEVFGLAGASAVAAASYLEQNGETSESRDCYQRGQQLAFAALVGMPEGAPKDSRDALEVALEMAKDKLERLEALEERDEAASSGAGGATPPSSNEQKERKGFNQGNINRRENPKTCPSPSLELCMAMGQQMENEGLKSLVRLEGVLEGCSQAEATRIMQACTEYLKD